MKKIIFISLLFLGALAFGQTVNPNQIRPSATNGQVLTTEAGATVWHDPAAGGVTSAQGIAPITVNGDSSDPHTGDITIACAGCQGSVLAVNVVPPVTGQYVVIYPTSAVCGAFGPTASCNATALGSDVFVSAGSGPHNTIGGSTITLAFTGYTLPSFVNPANVTAVYGYTVATVTGLITNAVGCTWSGGGAELSPTGGLGTYTPHFTGLTGAGISTVSCTGSWVSSLFTAPFINSGATNGPAALIVYYSGTAPPPSTSVGVAFPLTYVNNTLGINPAQPFPGLYELPYLVSQLPTSATFPVVPVTGAVYNVVDGASAIDCSTGGGSTQVSCQWNGSSYVAVGGSGTGGLSGMTAGQIPIAANATSVTSSKMLAGAGTGITTGPTTSVNGDITCFSGTTGQLSDCGTPLNSVVTLNGTQSLMNKIINGVVLDASGPTTEFLNHAGGYSSPAGSGTVTHTSGALTAGQVVIGNNSADIKVDTGCSTDGSGNQTCASLATNGPTPGKVSLAAGTGSIPALAANSAGFAAPVTGGTAYLFKLPATASAGLLAAGAPGTVDGVNESAITVVPFPWSCQPGLGDGLNAISAATYLQTTCYNDTGKTVTLTGIKCFTDNSGSSTLAATNGAGTALLTGAVTCTTAFAAGTQSATTTIASGDFIKFTFVADGTSKQGTFVVSGTHP